jgi:hypothetical protein
MKAKEPSIMYPHVPDETIHDIRNDAATQVGFALQRAMSCSKRNAFAAIDFDELLRLPVGDPKRLRFVSKALDAAIASLRHIRSRLEPRALRLRSPHRLLKGAKIASARLPERESAMST